MRQIIDTLIQLQRLRDRAVKDMTVALAKQQQVCLGYENNIKALGYLIQKTRVGDAVPSAESLKNVAGYKGTLRTVIACIENRLPATRVPVATAAPRTSATGLLLDCDIGGLLGARGA